MWAERNVDPGLASDGGEIMQKSNDIGNDEHRCFFPCEMMFFPCEMMIAALISYCRALCFPLLTEPSIVALLTATSKRASKVL